MPDAPVADAADHAVEAGSPVQDGQPSPSPVRPPWRIRDLDRRGLAVAVVLGALLLLPFLWSAARALDLGWRPASDDALIAVRTHDVFSRHFPLIGQPSTSSSYSDVFTYHPGPMAFWLVAPLQAVFGPAVGQLFGPALINGLATVTAAWVVFRRAGPRVALGATVVLGLVVWCQGTAVMSDPVSSNLGGYASMATGFLAWALMRGDVRLAPLAAFWAAFASQQHLAYTGAVGLLGVVTAVVTVVVLVRRWRAEPTGSPRWRHDVGWLAAGLGLGILLWAPPLIQQVTGDPGNMTEVVRFARLDDRPSLGLRSGLNQVMRPLGDLGFLFRGDHDGDEIRQPMSTAGQVLAYGMLGLLAAIVVVDRRRRPERAALAGVALLLGVARVVNGANIPAGLEPARVNLYRSLFGFAAVAWLAIAWFVVAEIRRRLPEGRPAWLQPVAVGAVALVLLVGDVGAFASRSTDDHWREEALFDRIPELTDPLIEALPKGSTVLVAPNGLLSQIAMGPAVALALEDAGFAVQVSPINDPYYGNWRSYEPGTVDAVVQVLSSANVPPESKVPGRLVAETRLNPELNALIDRLVPTLQGETVRKLDDPWTPLLDDGMTRRYAFATLLAVDSIGKDPATALRNPRVIRALQLGVLVEPEIPAETVDEMARLLEEGGDPAAWNDDWLEVRLVEPEDWDRPPPP